MTSKTRPATEEDICRWYGHSIGTMRAIIVEVDGEPIVIGGVIHQQHCYVAFMDMKEIAKKYPVLLIKSSLKAIREIFHRYKQPIYAVQDTTLPTSARYLSYLGFVPAKGSEDIWVIQLPQDC